MSKRWISIVGEPREFLTRVPDLARRFEQTAKVSHSDLNTIRCFVKARNYEISNDPEIFREVLAAFVCVLRDFHAQKIQVVGLWRKRLEVISAGYRGDLLDLFYRCIFEEMDLVEGGEPQSKAN